MLRPMWPTVLTFLGPILVALAAVFGGWLTSRNDRALALQELDLYKRLNPDSTTAKDLGTVIALRVSGWKKRAIRSARRGRVTFRDVVTVFVFLYLILFAVVITLQVTGVIRPILPM